MEIILALVDGNNDGKWESYIHHLFCFFSYMTSWFLFFHLVLCNYFYFIFVYFLLPHSSSVFLYFVSFFRTLIVCLKMIVFNFPFVSPFFPSAFYIFYFMEILHSSLSFIQYFFSCHISHSNFSPFFFPSFYIFYIVEILHASLLFIQHFIFPLFYVFCSEISFGLVCVLSDMWLPDYYPYYASIFF